MEDDNDYRDYDGDACDDGNDGDNDIDGDGDGDGDIDYRGNEGE